MTKDQLPLFPEAASEYASKLDWLYHYMNAVSIFFTVLIMGVIIVFSVVYRRKSDADRPKEIHGNLTLEIISSIVPFFLFLSMFIWGVNLYFQNARPPEDAMEILVTGKQWMWKIQHPSGKREINDVHLPVDTPVKFTMTSEDVIHSFWVPAFRTKMDVVPGKYTQMWALPNKIGQYHLLCAEFCGAEHSRMIGEVYVVSKEDYQEWADYARPSLTQGGQAAATEDGPAAEVDPDREPMSAAAKRGAEVFKGKGACFSCHVKGMNPAVKAPPLVGMYNTERELHDGTKVIADDNYLLESIENPMAKVVKDYGIPGAPQMSMMVPYKGVLSAAEIQDLIQYIKYLKEGDSLAKP